MQDRFVTVPPTQQAKEIASYKLKRNSKHAVTPYTKRLQKALFGRDLEAFNVRGSFHEPVPVQKELDPEEEVQAPQKRVVQPQEVEYTRCLDGPDVIDDFYINVIDWGSKGDVAIALNRAAYHLKLGRTSKTVTLLHALHDYYVSSLVHSPSADKLYLGDSGGDLHCIDVGTGMKTWTYALSTQKIGVMRCNEPHTLYAGNHAGVLIRLDVRTKKPQNWLIDSSYVCGLALGPMIATGSNSNMVKVWDSRLMSKPVFAVEHNAAVRALAWHPDGASTLLTGAGTADRHIRILNCGKGTEIGRFDTGSQVINLAWLQEDKVIASHGFSRNSIKIWDLETQKHEVEMLGHTSRVLFMAASPQEDKLISMGGDELVLLWDIPEAYRGRKQARYPYLGESFEQLTIR